MLKDRKTPVDKLGALLARQRSAAAPGDLFPQRYPGDFYDPLPLAQYLGDNSPCLPAGRVYDVREYGAVPNDRQRLATLEINYAVNLCSEQGGGTVLLSGGDYYCQTIELKSNVTLFIEKGSRLVASRESSGYRHHALLYCHGAEQVTVTGGGTICGDGTYFSTRPAAPPNMLPEPVSDVPALREAYEQQKRRVHPSGYGSLFHFAHCRQVRLCHVLLEDAAGKSCAFYQCSHVTVHHTVIQNNRHISEADGIAIIGSSYVTVEHCFIAAGGDCVTLKNAIWMDCKDAMGHIMVRDCEMVTHANAFHIGTQTTGDIYDVTVEECRFFLPDIYPGMMAGAAIESCDGAMVCDVTLRNIEMQGVTCPILIRLNNRNQAAALSVAGLPAWQKPKDVLLPASKERFDWKGVLRRVTVSNITAKDVEMPVILTGIMEMGRGVKYVEDIIVEDCSFTYRRCREMYDKRLFVPEYAKDSSGSWGFGNLPAYGLWARHVKRLTVRHFRCVPAQSTWKTCFVYENIE